MYAVVVRTCNFSFLCSFSSRGGVCVLMCRVYGVCACGFIPKGPISDVSRIARGWGSSSGSQPKAFRSHNHFHWIYKVQLKFGGIWIHEWFKRGSCRSCLNWSENCRSQLGKGCGAAGCRHQRGWGSWGWQAHMSIALFPYVLQATVVVFSTFHHIKQAGSQRPASKSVERLLMTCLGSRARSAQYGFNLPPAFGLCEWADLTGSEAFSCPGYMPHLPSCVLQYPLQLFPVKGEFQLKQTNALDLEGPSTFCLHCTGSI